MHYQVAAARIGTDGMRKGTDGQLDYAYLQGVERFNYWDFVDIPDVLAARHPDIKALSSVRVGEAHDGGPSIPAILAQEALNEDTLSQLLRASYERGNRSAINKAAEISINALFYPWVSEQIRKWRKQNTPSSRRKLMRLFRAYADGQRGKGKRMGIPLLEEIRDDLNILKALAGVLKERDISIEEGLRVLSEEKDYAIGHRVRLRSYGLNRRIWREYRKRIVRYRWLYGKGMGAGDPSPHYEPPCGAARRAYFLKRGIDLKIPRIRLHPNYNKVDMEWSRDGGKSEKAFRAFASEQRITAGDADDILSVQRDCNAMLEGLRHKMTSLTDLPALTAVINRRQAIRRRKEKV